MENKHNMEKKAYLINLTLLISFYDVSNKEIDTKNILSKWKVMNLKKS